MLEKQKNEDLKIPKKLINEPEAENSAPSPDTAKENAPAPSPLRVIRREPAQQKTDSEKNEPENSQTDTADIKKNKATSRNERAHAPENHAPALKTRQPREVFKPTKQETDSEGLIQPPAKGRPSLLPHLWAAMLFTIALALTMATGLIKAGLPLLIKPIWTGVAIWLIVLLIDMLFISRRRILGLASSVFMFLMLVPLLLALTADALLPQDPALAIKPFLPHPFISGAIALLCLCATLLIQMKTWPKYPAAIIGNIAAAALLTVYGQPIWRATPILSGLQKKSTVDGVLLTKTSTATFVIGIPENWTAKPTTDSPLAPLEIHPPGSKLAITVERQDMPSDQTLAEHATGFLEHAQRLAPDASGIITSTSANPNALKTLMRTGDTVTETTFIPALQALFVVTAHGTRSQLKSHQTEISAILGSLRPL